MAHINRRYIDKHWFVFIIRGILASVFGTLLLFGGLNNLPTITIMAAVFLLSLGIVDALSALYNSTKKHGWINAVIDASVDIIGAIALLFLANNNLVSSVIILSVYVTVSGLIDLFHGFLSTVDPTDRFIKVLAGACGCIIGLVILNAGGFEMTTFLRFFGVYMLIVAITSLIYGVHNRAQNIEDRVARKESYKARSKKSRK